MTAERVQLNADESLALASLANGDLVGLTPGYEAPYESLVSKGYVKKHDGCYQIKARHKKLAQRANREFERSWRERPA